MSSEINSVDKKENNQEKTRTIGLDDIFHSSLSKFFGWFSPASFYLAYFDWFAHLSMSPDKHLELTHSFIEKYQVLFDLGMKLSDYNQCANVVECKSDDQRFKHALWRTFPFYFYSQNFLLWEKFWDEATTNIQGLSKHHERVVNFSTRQILDILSPSNYMLTNPEVLSQSIQQGGLNLAKGLQNYYEDYMRIIEKKPPFGTEQFQVGVNVATTKGKVIFRNHLIELIQYLPKTEKVFREPILIVPAWIMKYYILDLSSHNSMVQYLVNEGHTVFMISWKNPNNDDRDLSLDDYINLGIMDALKIINQIVPETKINTVGYCIGGTLLTIAAAYMAKIDDNRLNSITLFAAQIDFKDAGELLLFIDESQITYLENIMREKGYLDGSQMAGTFSMLHPVKLIWSRVIREYLLGTREPLIDLMAWDYDTTRLPYRMHSEYLRKLFLNNDLVQGKFAVNGKKIMLLDINIPIFSVGTTTDHVAPWKSVYKIHFFTESDITFVLTKGGHNAGIVSEPGHKNRSYQIKTVYKTDKRIGPDKWRNEASLLDGSWWLDWHKWLVSQSKQSVKPPMMGNPSAGISVLCEAPGTYVLMK